MVSHLDPKSWQLESERLIIRASQPGDGAIVNAAIHESFAELTLWMPWARVLPTPEESEAVALRAYQDFAAGKDYSMRVWLKDGTFVGACGFHRGNRNVPSFEVGYWCRTSLAGQGYISETVKTLCDFAFGDFGIERLEIRCDARNQGSRRVAEQCGFELEGILRRSDRANDGTLRDNCIFARFPHS